MLGALGEESVISEAAVPARQEQVHDRAAAQRTAAWRAYYVRVTVLVDTFCMLLAAGLLLSR